MYRDEQKARKDELIIDRLSIVKQKAINVIPPIYNQSHILLNIKFTTDGLFVYTCLKVLNQENLL